MANVGAYYILDGHESFLIPQLCIRYNISHIRLSEPNIDLFLSFRYTQIHLSFDIPNHWLGNISINNFINNFFDTYLKPFISNVKFRYIIVGKDMNDNILPTMKDLQDILDANSPNKIMVTTQWSYDGMLLTKDPPSAGALNDPATVRGIVTFLKVENTPLMIDAYPYHKYIRNNNISLGYATFGRTSPVQDGRFLYYNLFDAMVDTFYAAISNAGLGDVDLMVETGWPTSGYKSTLSIAANYNKKFKTHISSNNGTPGRPGVPIEGFIRGLFNDDGGAYGVFGPDLTPMYPLFE